IETHIEYIRPSLTEHVRSTAMDRHIGYTRPSLTEHVRSTVRWTDTLDTLDQA
ncbi:hypothetical protein AeNC1_014490, partial [Aphanomyces euteiches]